MDELIEYVRANGMPEEVRIDLTQKGYNDSQLEVIRERILEYRHQDLVESQVSEAQRLMLWAMDVQSASLTSVRDMMRMDALSDRDRIAELYRNRLIDETEMQRRMAAADPERSMPVAQLQFISGYHRGLLVRNGLLNSKHVLDRAKTRATRRSLAKQVGVDALLVLEWANRADLLRIGGLSQAHADLLENVGVDTVVELTNVVNIPPNFYILKLVNKKDSQIPSHNEVKEEVTRKVIGSKAEEKARQAAEDLLNQIRTGKNIRDVAREKGYFLEGTGFFSRMAGVIPKIGPAREMMEILSSLTEKNPLPKEVLKTKDGYFVVRLSG